MSYQESKRALLVSILIWLAIWRGNLLVRVTIMSLGASRWFFGYLFPPQKTGFLGTPVLPRQKSIREDNIQRQLGWVVFTRLPCRRPGLESNDQKYCGQQTGSFDYAQDDAKASARDDTKVSIQDDNGVILARPPARKPG
jgi:hypothetical protein